VAGSSRSPRRENRLETKVEACPLGLAKNLSKSVSHYVRN